MDVNKVNDILNKYQILEQESKILEQENKKLNDDLIKHQTLLNQNLEELKKYNISPENLEQEIEKLSLEIEQDINEYNKLTTTINTNK